MLKVLHICQRDDPTTGGAVRVAIELCKALPMFDIAVDCLFLYGPPGPFSEELKDRAHYLGLRNSKDVLRHGLRHLKVIRNLKPDIIHHHDGLIWPQVLELFYRRVKRVTHAHLDAGIRSFGLRTRIANYFQINLPDLLFCVSETTANTWKTAGVSEKQIVVVSNGINPVMFHPGTEHERNLARRKFGVPESAFVLLFVGRLHSVGKGVDDFVRVVARLPKECWGLIVGSGPDESTLISLAKDLGVSNRIVFSGAQQNTSTAYHAADVLLMMSYFESFGLVVLESMASGIPVMGFACPGGLSKFFTEETGTVIQERNLQELCVAILKFIEAPSFINGKAVFAREFAIKNYSWAQSAELVAKSYHKLFAV